MSLAAGITFTIFHFGMPVRVSPFLRNMDRLFFVKTGGKQERSQEDAKLCQVSGEPGRSVFGHVAEWGGGQLYSLLRALLAMLMQEHLRSVGFLQAVSRSAVCSSSGRGDELGNEAQYCWSVSQ